MKFRILFIVMLFCSQIFASTENKFIIQHDGLIDQRAQDKILEIGNEVQSKLGFNIYVNIQENNGIDMSKPRSERIKLMKEYDKFIFSKLPIKQNYVILTMVIDQKYANILMSENLKKFIDKDEILTGYVIPLLASKDKNTLFAKTSAACLNGYAQIADVLAEQKNIKLVSSIGSEGKTVSTIWKVLMYSLVLFGILVYAYVVLKERKK